MHNSIFVSGLESYPALRGAVIQSGAEAEIRVLPLGSDLVGPRSDHVAFEERRIPCLFFSCGTCKDYHEPTDTPDKLDYGAIARSTRLLVRTAHQLASSESHESPSPDNFAREELNTVKTVLSEARKNSAPDKIKADDLRNMEQLEQTAENLLKSGEYDRAAREHLAVEAAGTLAPYLMPGGNWKQDSTDEKRKEQASGLQLLQLLYLNYHREMMAGYKKLVAHILKYRPSPFRGMPKFDYEIYDVPEGNIFFQKSASNQWSLSVLVYEFALTAESPSLWLFKTFGASISAGTSSLDCAGSRTELVDYCLLRMRTARTNELHLRELRRVLSVVEEELATAGYPELLQARLARGGFQNETDWIVHCVRSRNPSLALEAIGSDGITDAAFQEALRDILFDRSVRPDVRASALAAMKGAGTPILSELCELLDDSSLAFRPDYKPRSRPDYPFANREIVKLMKPIMESQSWGTSAKTIADLVREKLRRATGHDFLCDSAKWKEWLQSNSRKH